MDELKTKLWGNNESQEEEQMIELNSIVQRIAQESGKKTDVMKMVMSMWNDMDISTSKEYIAFFMTRMKQMTKYDIETKILYAKAMKSTKHLQLFLKNSETNNNSTDSKTYIDETVDVMKALGKMLRLRSLMQAQLDMSLMNHIENLTKKKDAEISIIEEIKAKIKHMRNRDIAVQTDKQDREIKQTEGHEQKEAKKRKVVFFLEDNKVQQKKKKIAQNEIEENFMESEEPSTLELKQGLPESLQQRDAIPQQSQVYAHQSNTANEGQFHGELSHEFLGQLEAMQQLVQQLRTRLLVRVNNQQTTNKSKTENQMMQELKQMKNQEDKAKKQQQRQQEIVGTINMPVDLRHKE